MSNQENIRNKNKMNQGAPGFGSQGMTVPKPAPRRGGPLGFGGPGGHGVQMQGEKAKNFKGTMAKFIKYISEFKAQVIIVYYFCCSFNNICHCRTQDIGKSYNQAF